MKISKKILGVALVLTMILNVFAVGAFAAFPDDTAVKLMVSTDKETYAQGDEIVLTVSEQVISAIGTMYIGGQYEFAYNSAVVEPYSTSGELGDHGFAAIQEGYDSSISGVQIPAQSSGATVAGTDATICYVVGDSSVAFDATSKVDLFTVKMKIKADAPDGTYTIGFNPAGYEECNAFSNDGIGMGGLYGTDASALGFPVANMYEYGSVTITVGAGGSTEPEQPTVKVNNLSTQVQWANKEAGLMNVGFRGQIAEGYDASADKAGTTGPNGGDNLAKLTEVGFYLNGTKYQAYTIYNFVDGGYFYRVVVGNVSYDSEATFSAQAYVMIDGQEYKADASFETTGKAQYERAITVGMEAK